MAFARSRGPSSRVGRSVPTMANPRSRKLRNACTRFFEPLEGRVLFATTPANVDLGLVGAAAVGTSGSASLVKNFTTNPATITDDRRLLAFRLGAAGNDLTLNFNPVTRPPGQTGTLRVGLIRDANGNQA